MFFLNIRLNSIRDTITSRINDWDPGKRGALPRAVLHQSDHAQHLLMHIYIYDDVLLDHDHAYDIDRIQHQIGAARGPTDGEQRGAMPPAFRDPSRRCEAINLSKPHKNRNTGTEPKE